MTPIVRQKWRDDVLDEGFVPFPKRLLRTMTSLLPADEGLRLLAAILAIVDCRGSHMDGSAPSQDYLAFIADVPVEQMARLIATLNELGLVHMASAGDRIAVDLNPLFDRVVSVSSLK